MNENRPYDPTDTDRVPLDPFAWPGGYSVLYMTEDGGTFCAAHAWQVIVTEDAPMQRETYDEGAPVQCDGDYSRPHYVLASYGDPDAEDAGIGDLDTAVYPEWCHAVHSA